MPYAGDRPGEPDRTVDRFCCIDRWPHPVVVGSQGPHPLSTFQSTRAWGVANPSENEG